MARRGNTSGAAGRAARELQRIRRRPSELLVGTFFRAVTRVAGLRPELVPAHMRRQLEVIGVTDEQLRRVLRNVTSLGDWPYAWEAEGDRRAADRDWLGACAAYYVAQRILLQQTRLKQRLYRLACQAYANIEHPAPLERISVEHDGDTIAGYLQVPARAAAGRKVPLVLMTPGVTATKEELHPFVDPLLHRGWAVARIDNPGYGETTGILRAGSEHNPAAVLEHVARDPRIDADNLHLLGLSLGGFWTLHSLPRTRAKSAIVIAAPFHPENFFADLPGMNLTALQHMSQQPDYERLLEFCTALSLRAIAPDIDVPVKIIHGGRDRTVPVTEAEELALSLGGPHALTIWERDHHICLEHFDEMIVEILEWLADPLAACARHARLAALQQAIDAQGEPPLDAVAEPA